MSSELEVGFSVVCPQVDYGGNSGAWNPKTRGPVYCAMERARLDNAFAILFAADIMYGKELSGDYSCVWEVYRHYQTDPRTGDDLLTSGGERIFSHYAWSRALRKFSGSKGSGWLYNENTLNAAMSGVALLFAQPAILRDGDWHAAIPTSPARSIFDGNIVAKYGGTDVQKDYTFVASSKLGNQEVIRLLNEGHYAFHADDVAGTRVYVPWAAGKTMNSVPIKEGRGRIEAENSKKTPVGRYYRTPM